MACNKNGNRCADAARRNGLSGQVSRYLNTLGNWSTYRDLSNAEDIPERVAQVTAAFFGLKGLLDGHPRLAGVLGVIIGVHALEHASGGLATMLMRLYGRGRPLVNYRGLLIRESISTPTRMRWLNRLTGGRVLAGRGYYFFESGRTWACQSITLQVGDQPRTLTRVQSYSIPHREFYFDRPIFVPEEDGREPEAGQKVIHIQRVVDTVLGDDNPDSIPGFIGSINELEDMSGTIGALKRTFFLTNWFLVDEGERDGGSSGVDYDALVKGTGPGGGQSGGGVYQVSRSPSPGWSPAGSSTALPVRTIPAYPSISRIPPPPPAPPYEAELLATRPAPAAYGANLFNAPSTQASGATQYAQYVKDHYKDRIRIGQQDYPLVVKRVTVSPFGNGARKADAVYFDEAGATWRVVDDDEDRINLAKAVEAGRLTVTPSADWPA